MASETHIRGSNYQRYLQPPPCPWWRRHRAGLACTVLLAIAILAAHYGAH